MITLNRGAVVGFPLSALPCLVQAKPGDLRKIKIEDGGYGLNLAALDADISVQALLCAQFGAVALRRSTTRGDRAEPGA